jgi:hypothetical protein
MAKAKKQRIEYSLAKKDWERMITLIATAMSVIKAADAVEMEVTACREYYLELAVSAMPEITVQDELADEGFKLSEDIRFYLEKVQAARRQAISVAKSNRKG